MEPQVLVDTGHSKTTIVIAEHPNRAVAFAAKELQYHIKRISGAVPAIITDKPTAVEKARQLGPLILIGQSKATDEAIGQVNLAPQEYMVALVGPKKESDTDPLPHADTIVLLGHDAGLEPGESFEFPARVPGKEGFGNACHFTGANRPIIVAGVDLDPYCGSLEAWIRPEAKEDGAGATILRIPAPGGRHILSLHYQQIPVKDHPEQLQPGVYVRYWVTDFTTDIPGPNDSIIETAGFPATEWYGQWHHILATYNTTSRHYLDIKLFVDGKFERHVNDLRWPWARIEGAGADVFVGGYVDGFDPTHRADFRGAIDEVRISRCLRYRTDMSVPSATGLCRADADTVLLLHFDEPDGAVSVTDSVTQQSTIYEHRCRLPGIWEDHDSLNAVYDFLERFYDVHWYAPTEVGVTCKPQPMMKMPVMEPRIDWQTMGKDEDREALILLRKPAMAHRDVLASDPCLWFFVGPIGKPEVPISDLDRHVWMLRMRMGGTPISGGHSLPGRCANFLQGYPGCFANTGAEPVTVGSVLKFKLPNGTDVPYQMCYTHEALIKTLIKDVCKHFEGTGSQLGANHTADSYSLAPADNSTWCQCAACTKQRFEQLKTDLFCGYSSYYIHNFTRRVARGVAERLRPLHPDNPEWGKRKWLGQAAYIHFAHYPRATWDMIANTEIGGVSSGEVEEIDGIDLGASSEPNAPKWYTFKKIEPNIFTWLCVGPRDWWHPKVQKNAQLMLDDWRRHALGEQLGAYLYYEFPVLYSESLIVEGGTSAGGIWLPAFRTFPGFCAHRVAELMTREADDTNWKNSGFKGMAGVHVETSGGFASILMDQLELYVTFRLADDDSLDVNKIIDSFFEEYYGPAAGPMKEFYIAVEEASTKTVEVTAPYDLTEQLAWGAQGCGTKERMARLLKLMALARALAPKLTKTQTSPENQPTCPYGERVDLFRRGMWDYMVEGYRNYWRHRQPESAKWPLVRLELWLPLMSGQDLKKPLEGLQVPSYFSDGETEILQLPPDCDDPGYWLEYQRRLKEHFPGWPLPGSFGRPGTERSQIIATLAEKLHPEWRPESDRFRGLTVVVPEDDDLLFLVASHIAAHMSAHGSPCKVLVVPTIKLPSAWLAGGGMHTLMLLWSESKILST